ncbi:biotin/lipoyl-binding carrier protein [Blastococcus sp. Marseille-P5729]|uniref:biotin/lipoyl-binding carrier protein n=1 Tax=Blastococcus sp. Marseille-P5729 TaxID=2086582 RepID=UPI000D0E5555|nr:biotin/lipoyl-binding carrier protein [Blastococcus sp. Marseille-P5729]
MTSTVRSEMVGNVTQVVVSSGDQVQTGDPLLFIESMRMEIPVEAEAAGTVAEVLVEPGASVRSGDPLIEIS